MTKINDSKSFPYLKFCQDFNKFDVSSDTTIKIDVGSGDLNNTPVQKYFSYYRHILTNISKIILQIEYGINARYAQFIHWYM